jgi:hypothetical protein
VTVAQAEQVQLAVPTSVLQEAQQAVQLVHNSLVHYLQHVKQALAATLTVEVQQLAELAVPV